METKENRSFTDLKSVKEFRFAKALFDNHSETEDELEFKRGDVLTVLSHNPKALIGWWLCVNHSDGRTGLAPANRLRAIPLPTYDVISGHRLTSNSCCALSEVTCSQSMNDDSSRRKSWNAFSREIQSNYDIPTNRQNYGSNIDLYDIPSQSFENTYDIPISVSRPLLMSASSESSDEIRCDSSCHLSDDSVRKRLSDEEMAEYSSDSIELDAIRSVYSFPKKSFGDLYDIPTNNRSVIGQQWNQSQDYDFPKASDSSMVWNNQCLETLSEIETKCLQTLEQLFKNFCFGTDWRSRDAINSSLRVTQLQVLCNDLNRFLQQFVSLCSRAVLFARTNASDIKMVNKLDQMVRQLSISLNIVQNCLQSMDAKNGWTVEKIVRIDGDSVSDDLDRYTACAKHISDDIRHLMAAIRGNSRLLLPVKDSPFSTPTSTLNNKPPIAPKPALVAKHRRQSSNTQLRPLPALPVVEPEIENEYNDYEDLSHDYVCLESKTQLIININNNNKSVDEVDKGVDTEVDNQNKLEVKAFYSQQMRNCCQLLQQSISELIDLIQKNQFQLTKVSLLNESKAVVVCGQKMIFVGQTLIRNCEPEGSKSVNDSINHLSDSVKNFVSNVRKACLTGRSFPSNQSVETVYQTLLEISVSANRMTQISL